MRVSVVPRPISIATESRYSIARTLDKHFAGVRDKAIEEDIPNGNAYRLLEAEVGHCGAAEIAGASVAAPYVSAIAAAVAVSRLIAVVSGCECPPGEVRQLSSSKPRIAPSVRFEARGMRHAGKPKMTS
jgi:hypothetical protein